MKLIHTLAICAAAFLAYALILLMIYPFAKVASYKPDPPPSATTRVVLTLSTRVPLPSDPNRSIEMVIAQTFVFAGDLARTVTEFFARFRSPSLFNLQKFPARTDGLIADLIITTHNGNENRQLTLLGPDAEDVLSFLAYCFNFQLATGTKEPKDEPASLTV